MNARIRWHGVELAVDFSAGYSLAIPLDPHGAQPSFFSDHPARARPLETGGFVGDMARGGSCNAEVIELAPHCHGTHTECRAHVCQEAITVQEAIYAEPGLARVISLATQDQRLSLAALQQACGNLAQPLADALVIRTLPNGPERMTRHYGDDAAYTVLTTDAMAWLAQQPLRHLLIDSPSLDPADDGGQLANHRCWWGLDGSPGHPGVDARKRSVTEMIFVPDHISDGLYWLHLGLSPIAGDATPSRPIIYPAGVPA